MEGTVDFGSDKQLLSRRDILKGAWVGAKLLALCGAVSLTPEVSAKPISYLLRTETGVNSFIGIASEFFQRKALLEANRNFNVQLNRNPDIKSGPELIAAGISSYGKPVRFPRELDLETDEHYFTAMDRAFSKLTLGDLYNYFVGSRQAQDKIARTEWTLAEDLLKDINPAANSILSFAGSQMDSLYEVACVPGSGFFKLLQGIDSVAANQVLSGESTQKDRLEEVETAVFKIIAPFEKKYVSHHKKEEKYSWSDVLADFLRVNGGDLSLSLFDTAILAKMFARNDLQSGKLLSSISGPQGIEMLCSRFKNIKDEYSPVGTNFGFDEAERLKIGFDSANKDFSVINRIGMYHVWYIYALLSKFPSLAIKHFTTMTQLRELESQGNIKTAMDFTALGYLQPLDSVTRKLKG